jgi:hypothetical protein
VILERAPFYKMVVRAAPTRDRSKVKSEPLIVAELIVDIIKQQLQVSPVLGRIMHSDAKLNF